MQLLRLDNVSKAYGALTVTDGLSLTLGKGEALGIIGPNGAGKTTLFNLIAGNVQPDRGSVHFNGRDITRLTPSARCHLGIGRSYQVPHPFGGMTVFENVLVGATFGAGRSERGGTPLALAALERTGLLSKANRLAGALPLLDRKRLELARALATQPDLLLLDEIAGGLTEHEVAELIESIQDIRASGTSIIWIEHIVHALLAVVDRLLVINFGKLLLQGNPAEVMASPEVQEIYLGMAVE
ncbi:MAG: ABC transporter ATP-binding protein [Rhodoferax sp.]|uniref:ABC transporter ATP-binding protein n=1 Tax=Rhodoferax sp. TaxID=50421 RepID=UPI002721678F|nr:ABC transporter ATP-binding protein [Rhodoferax sp.]MDO8449984.1 ABC transporter ATP-binding protein [Rhodoferax sp.]